jgi:uncharacterized protein YegL
MHGEPIEAVRMGLRTLVEDLQSEPQALETVYLSVITFASSAVQACPLTELAMFQVPYLTAGGARAMGEALCLLEKCIDLEVRKPLGDQKGDWKPLIFLLTDGVPTDNWEQAAESLRDRKLGRIIACAAGEGADPELLRYISSGDDNMVVQLKNLTPNQLQAFFNWISISVNSTSLALAGPGPVGVGLPPTPPEVVVVP